MVIAKQPLDLNFEEWIDLVFNHPVPDDPDDVSASWYWMDEWDLYWEAWCEETEAGSRQLLFSVKLFEDSSILIDRFDPDQINQGMWLLLSGPSGFNLADLLWKKSFQLRRSTGVCCQWSVFSLRASTRSTPIWIAVTCGGTFSEVPPKTSI